MKKRILSITLILAAIALVSFLGVFTTKYIFAETEVPVQQNSAVQAKPINKMPVLGIMIENEIASRPFHKGLNEAEIVYEALVEGGITRFLAIFDGGKYPEKMGPVRSARVHYVDWIQEYPNALYAHVGGSVEAVARASRELERNVDQFTYDAYFKRENIGKTVLEHTMFTSKEFMEKLIKDNKWNTETEETEVLKKHFLVDDKSNYSGYKDVKTITIPFSTRTYTVTYSYDAVLGKFLRNQAGKPHMDTLTQEQISASTVIVQYVQTTAKTTGNGEAIIFTMGKIIPATWSKSSISELTKFAVKETGTPITIPSGNVWIEIVPSPIVATF